MENLQQKNHYNWKWYTWYGERNISLDLNFLKTYLITHPIFKIWRNKWENGEFGLYTVLNPLKNSSIPIF